MNKKKNSVVMLVLIVALTIMVIVTGIWYQVYQFQLCYPEVSSSYLYCWQHAFGN